MSAGDENNQALCPALFFCAPASGQGKTTITSGIARYHRNRGLDVRVFKTGPDYMDPLILSRASGNPVAQLDLWMTGEAHCKARLYQAAREADLILVEGVMGMFDGDPSGADMAEYFGIPIAIVINARSMAQTFGAIAHGLATWRPELAIAGVIANLSGSQRHVDLITESMPDSVKLLGYVHNTPDMALPERHLGLVHPHEVDDIERRLDRIAEAVAKSGLDRLPEPVAFYNDTVPTLDRLLEGLTIAIARDDAFTFIYDDNLNLLTAMGAGLQWFSPLVDEALPECDALWLPGGYPELHHLQLATNASMQMSIKAFHANGGRILAECGGMLYLMEALTNVEGHTEKMVGLLRGTGIMQDRGGCQGMQYAPLPGGEVRAHAHHRTRCENTLQPVAFGRRIRHPSPGEPIYRYQGITASYLHLYFPSNPEAIAAIFR